MGEIEISLDTLPAYLRGEGHPGLADEIEAAGRDTAKLLVALGRAEGELDGEALVAVSSFARLMRQAERLRDD
jgi:hypothetical protein